jgi:putative ABC transport system permease protein
MLFELLKLAMRTLRANGARSILTMLGITIGVGAVITLLAVGTGVQKYINDQFSSAGTNLVAVQAGRAQRGPGGGGFGAQAAITMSDYRAIIANVQGITSHTADISRAATFVYNAKNSEVNVQGVTPDYLTVRNISMGVGRFFEEGDDQSRARVVVLGQTVVDDLFPDEDPLDKVVRLNGLPFKVVGVLAPRGKSLFGDQDATAMIPLSTAHERLFANQARTPNGDLRLNNILIQAADDKARNTVKQSITDILRIQHRLPDDEDNDFTVLTSAELIDAFGAVTGVLTVFLGAIASISLLVGGIGIMNIMLVSVTERTREIGLRKAIGAKSRLVLMQFLIEAVFLSLIGGILGILFGVAGAKAIDYFASFETVVQAQAVFLAMGFSVAVGLFFGIYPARRASRLNPIDALRYE